MPIVWRKEFPLRERPLGYLRLLLARHRFHTYYTIGRTGRFRIGLKQERGYRLSMHRWRDKYKGRRCFVIGNGPSLQQMDIPKLKNEITIGCNGIYKEFADWGFYTNYILFEDIQQTELRRKDILKVNGPIKLAGIHNAYAFKADENTYFMYCRIGDKTYWDHLAPMFSEDFPNIVYLGSTVTYISLQLAFHLGCDPVYLIGVDHNYGELPKLFPPGKITITEENIHLVRGLHFDDDYYKVGDQIGVPNVKIQEDAYAKAREVYERHGRHIYNAGLNSKLEVFEKCNFDDLFQREKKKIA